MDHLSSIRSVTDVDGDEIRRQKHSPFGDRHYVMGNHPESRGWIGVLPPAVIFSEAHFRSIPAFSAFPPACKLLLAHSHAVPLQRKVSAIRF
jgi:hypothetical protein